MTLVQQITEFAQASLPDDSLFLVEVSIKNSGKQLVTILVDGDKGISIDQCAAISLKVGQLIEEHSLFEVAYQLEVSSPGIDEPLRYTRQYQANIGRKVAITTKDGKIRIGKLEQVEEQTVNILEEIREKGKKKVELVPLAIPFAEITKTVVQVSFK